MTPLGALSLGYLMVLVDIRVPALDIVPDPLGWVCIVVGLSRLAELDARFRLVVGVAAASGLLSVADLVHPLTEGAGPVTTTEPVGMQGWLVTGYIVASVLADVLLCLALRNRARSCREPAVGRTFTRFAVLHLSFGAFALALLAAFAATDDRPAGLLAAVVVGATVGGLTLAACFLIALARCRKLPWLQAVPAAHAPLADARPP